MIAAVGGTLFGFDISSMSAVVGTDQYLTFFDNPTGVLQGAIGSALAAGSIVGSACSGYFSDWLGRRDAIWYSCVFWLIGTALQTAVQDWKMLLAGRIINGLTVGVTSSQVPVYLAEISKVETRGSIIMIQQVAIDVGFTIYFFVGYGCSFIPGPSSFRATWGVQFVPTVILMIGFLFLPESPRWLASKDRVDEALEILAKIQAGGDINDVTVLAEWEEIVTTLRIERETGRGWRKFILNGMWRRTLVGFMVQACQQLTGANVITYYVVYLFQMANLTGNTNLIASSVNYILALICTALAFLFINKSGRRPLLIYGSLGMGVCHFIIGAMIAAFKTPAPGGVGGNLNVLVEVTGIPSRVMIAFSYLLIVVYYFTVAPTTWVYSAEVWSLGTRATGMGIATVGNWAFNFALGMFIPPAFKAIDFGLFILFGGLCIFAAVFAFLMYPETCGKTLEEVEIMFATGGPHAWQTGRGGSRFQQEVDFVVNSKRKEMGDAEHLEEATIG
ncbi:sugar transporter [Penicillium angulare]|uniref:Sugar transporter n=1 Tax=Penicillium angulare TaxID=116970 RepID=A0A9W9KQH6_9EURO|nr:sugar transporter [Penicillium angulare]